MEMKRFRPNLVVSGLSAFGEDDFKTIHIGDVKFENVGGCPR